MCSIFKMTSFDLHHGLEPPDGRVAHSMHLLLGDGVPCSTQGGFQVIDIAGRFAACPPLQNGLDAEVHNIQVWGGGWPKVLGPESLKNSLAKMLGEV